ncbi:hypothetical protein ACFFJY_09935 [Fictibacillus aquaticus]|uniref:Uncharacterized protein n=1 Tax=Fictibacillus aquaticus TaxID=2021314 RepID=A0A235FBA1_9BACL|nr:hypothetical protein [Fictibacillus aquaticus]OYD58588.1 hypothetical protein CGZ90_01415 [Fictibacillus aquaticus]
MYSHLEHVEKIQRALTISTGYLNDTEKENIMNSLHHAIYLETGSDKKFASYSSIFHQTL